MYQINSKKPMSCAGELLEHSGAATPRAAPRKVMTDPAPAAQAMPINRPLPKRVGWSGLAVQGVDGHQQRESSCGYRSMGHDQGHDADDQKGAQENKIGLFADNGEHLIGHALGETRRREGGADDYRAEDEPDRGVEEIPEGVMAGADHEQRPGTNRWRWR